MSALHKNRFYRVVQLSAISGVILGLTLYALKENIQLYLTPSEWYANKTLYDFRLGGLVAPKSIKAKDQKVSFIITDGHASINVIYQGVLPSLFRENKGAIVEGHMYKGIFYAQTVLAKHDENYQPPNYKAKL